MSDGERGRPDSTADAAPDRAERHALVQGFVLTVLRGPDAGAARASSGPRLTIGTHASADLVLTDPTVSRFHCQIEIAGGRAVLRDLDSRNGVTVGGLSVLEAHVPEGAVLGLGQTRIRFERAPGDVKVALSARRRFGQLVGQSEAMRAVFALLEGAAAGTSTVLIEGETGTGKEAAAEAIHRESDRRAGPYVIVDCGALPPELIASELFGHERGAFTGAERPRAGAFEEASGGTIVLDEIGELPLDLQPKLLRVLERREIKRVGRNSPTPVDARVIAATNRDLRGEVNAHRFRSDLYYRLAVMEVRLPPLREHLDDLPLLVEHLLGELGAAGRPEAERLRGRAVVEELRRHAWPGNVRELRNHIERALAHGGAPAAAPAPERPGPLVDATRPLREVRADFERRYLEERLAEHGGNVTTAARAAGLDRSQFYRMLWRHGLR